MANNTQRYGFRRFATLGGGGCPEPVDLEVATGYQATDASARSVDLNPGDPIKILAAGTGALAGLGDTVYGIMVGVKQYWDGTVVRPGASLPGATAWGTIEARRSIIQVIPAKLCIWEIDVDDNTTATTAAAYRLLYGSNGDAAVPGDGNGKASPVLDVSDLDTTATNTWRFLRVSPTVENKDLSGTRVKVLVRVNDSAEAGAAATPQDGL